jgi:hypothetical protein
MPGYLLHSGATVNCTHAGIATPMQTSTQVTVGGQPIVTQACAYSIAGCQLPTITVGAAACVSAVWVSAALQVTSNGAAVLLTDSQALCQPTQMPLVIGATQFAVTGA